MNIFVIHSNADKGEISPYIENLKKKLFSVNILILKNGNIFWKFFAKRKIKKAQIVHIDLCVPVFDFRVFLPFKIA